MLRERSTAHVNYWKVLICYNYVVIFYPAKQVALWSKKILNALFIFEAILKQKIFFGG